MSIKTNPLDFLHKGLVAEWDDDHLGSVQYSEERQELQVGFQGALFKAKGHKYPDKKGGKKGGKGDSGGKGRH